MLPMLVTTLVVLVIGAITVGLVVMGMEGRGHRRAPVLGGTMARAARHLNGETNGASRGGGFPADRHDEPSGGREDERVSEQLRR